MACNTLYLVAYRHCQCFGARYLVFEIGQACGHDTWLQVKAVCDVQVTCAQESVLSLAWYFVCYAVM